MIMVMDGWMDEWMEIGREDDRGQEERMCLNRMREECLYSTSVRCGDVWWVFLNSYS